MATSKTKPARRMGKRAVEDEVLATADALATALHRVGAMDELSMREMDRLGLPPRPDYGGAEVRRIRAATRIASRSSLDCWGSINPPLRNGSVVPSGHPDRRCGCWRCSTRTNRTARWCRCGAAWSNADGM